MDAYATMGRARTGPLELYIAPAPAAASCRRRLRSAVLGLVALAALAWGAPRAAAALGDVPASVPERRPSPIVYVVEPGDTLWSIARQLQPEGDVRPLVRRLVAAHGGAELAVGDRLVVAP